jgi:hypothetical protein
MALVVACGALRCTYDFDRFAPTVAAASEGGVAQNPSVPDASSGGSPVDQSSGAVDSATGETTIDALGSDAKVSDAAAGTTSDAGCGAACISTSQSCAATCNSTGEACVADCKRDNCRTMCMTTRTTCLVACVTKCQSCTQDAGCQENVQCNTDGGAVGKI